MTRAELTFIAGCFSLMVVSMGGLMLILSTQIANGKQDPACRGIEAEYQHLTQADSNEHFLDLPAVAPMKRKK